MQEYEEIFKEKFENNSIEYGIVRGNEKVLFIKVGQDGSIYGYENKYLEIAYKINTQYGYSLVVASHFEKGVDTIGHAVEFIQKNITPNPLIYYLGISKGASLGATCAYKYKEIKCMLLINPPLMINYHKIKKGLEAYAGEKAIVAIGSLDPSFAYAELIPRIKNPAVSLEIIENADHNFKGKLDVFIKLIGKFLI